MELGYTIVQTAATAPIGIRASRAPIHKLIPISGHGTDGLTPLTRFIYISPLSMKTRNPQRRFRTLPSLAVWSREIVR